MSAIYIFYADTYWFTNCAMNLAALVLCGIWGKHKLSVKRILLASMSGALAETLLVLVLHPFRLNVVLNYIFIVPFLLAAGLKINSIQRFFQELIRLYFVFLVMGGLQNWLWGNGMKTGQFLLVTGAGTVILSLILMLDGRYRVVSEKICNVTVRYGEVEVAVLAFCDTGNLLTEPYFHRPVSIMNQEAAKPILEAYQSIPGWIPYHTIAEQGMIETITVDELCTFINRRKCISKNAVIGLTKEPILKNNCQMLLNAAHISR